MKDNKIEFLDKVYFKNYSIYKYYSCNNNVLKNDLIFKPSIVFYLLAMLLFFFSFLIIYIINFKISTYIYAFLSIFMLLKKRFYFIS